MESHISSVICISDLFLALWNRTSVVGLKGRENERDDRQAGRDRSQVEQQGQSDLKYNSNAVIIIYCDSFNMQLVIYEGFGCCEVVINRFYVTLLLFPNTKEWFQGITSVFK